MENPEQQICSGFFMYTRHEHYLTGASPVNTLIWEGYNTWQGCELWAVSHEM